MNFLFKSLILFLILSGINELRAQAPVNDDCENAGEIIISNKGFDFGTFVSAKVNIANATKEKAESCVKELEETGNCSKTVWYKFYIPTTRNVSVKLTQQDSAIPQIFAGFNIYKVADCNYNLSTIASQLTALNKFGESGNSCLEAGWYLVQVGFKQKAKGEIWIELKVSFPQGHYDDHSNYYDFKVLKNQEKTQRFYFDCTSLEAEEFNQLKDSSLKSIWVKYTFAPNSVYNSVFFKKPSGPTFKALYRVFKNSINSDSLKNNKPYLSIPFDNFILQQNCPISDSQTYFLQIVVKANEYGNVEMIVSNVTYKLDDWNTPNTTNVANISSSKSYAQTHYYNCEGLMKNHKCKNVIPDYFLNKYKKTVNNVIVDLVDTLKIGGYTIINVLEDGLVKLYRGTYCFYSLYQGDIRNTCSLTPINVKFNSSYYYYFCVPKGVYTLLTAVPHLDFSNEQSIKMEKPLKLNIKYNNPKNPNKLPAFNPLAGKDFFTESVTYPDKDTIIAIDTLKIIGKMFFHEINIIETGDFNMGSFNGYTYIFRGSISKGNLQLINGLNYKDKIIHYGFYKSYSWSGTSNYGSCFSLPKGNYTIINLKSDDPYYNIDCKPVFDSLYFLTNKACPLTNNNESKNAFPINGNQDVFTDASKQNLDYIHWLAVCTDCRSSNTINPPKVSCRNKKLINANTNYSFYTFYVEENCELKLFTNGSPLNTYELYEGNVLTDPNLLQDTTKIIGPCVSGNLICNLQGKKIYTLVLINPFMTGNYVLYFTKHAFSKNDYAAHAYDFGHLLENKTVKSSYEPITCHTNGFFSDPLPPYEQNNGTNYNIPYKDTLNYKRNVNLRKNLWYTFTASGYSQIDLSVLNSVDLGGRHTIINVFKYKGVFTTSFKNALSNNFDSTIKGMECIGNATDSMKFINTGCMDNRYFVLLEETFYQRCDYALKIKNSLLKVKADGDLCSDAATGNYNKFGKYYISTNNTCHTYGNSFFEETPDKTIKSTWYKIKVTNLEKFDLQIRNNYSQGLLRYNVYGGNCNALTRITNVTDRYSYFTLNCMGVGEYYIQAICSLNIDENLQFEVNILNPVNIVCKPYNFKNPLAQFKLYEACQANDTIRLKNLSTIGTDISYDWYLNNKLISNDHSLILFRQNPKLLTNNIFKLVVTNNAENLRDTFILNYKNDTIHYKFKIEGPLKTYYCTDTLKLFVNTNYPFKINYSWWYYNEKSIIGRSNPLIQTFPENYMYYVQGQSDNCFFKDSFKVNVITSLRQYRDTNFCEGQKLVLKRNMGFYVNNKQVLITDSLIINKTGKYRIQYFQNKCWYMDTMNVWVEPGPKLLKYTDSLYYCNVPSVDLSYKYEKLLNYQWNTGDSSPSIKVNTNGNYNLKGPFSKCRNLDYTVNLKMETIDKDRLKDTIVCRNSNLTLTNPYPSDFKVLVMEPPQSSILSKSYFKRKLVLQKSQCKITDTSMVYVFPYQGKIVDSLYCDSMGNFKMRLDAGNAQTYKWYRNTHTSRTLDIFNYGNYPVSRIDLNGCRDTINFTIINSCPFQVFIPNVFSPNGNLINDNFSPSVSGPFKLYEMTIFNRWGEQLFQTKNSEPWNGHYMNSIVQQGVYWYSIVVYDIYDKPHRQIGSVIVLR